MKNKYILSIVYIIGIVLLISSVSAWDFDNVKRYNETTKTITIVNAFGIPLIDKEIATIQLLTPTNMKVGIGYQLVAAFKIKVNEDYKDVFKEMEFFDKRKSDEQINLNFDYRIHEVYDVVIDDYTTECDKDKIDVNGSIICTTRKDGSHIEQRERWNLINPSDLYKDEVITIGIFTETYQDQIVEWIPNLFGVRIDEWAIWTANLNTDLVAYYKLDEAAGDVLDSLGTYNGTNIGATPNVAGIINTAYDFELDTNECINITHVILPLGVNANWTVSVWYKPETIAIQTYLVSQYIAAADGRMTFGQDNGKVQYWMGGAGGGQIESDVLIATGNWYNLVYTRTVDNVTLYLNGTQVATGTSGGTIVDDYTSVGCGFSGAVPLSEADGVIDEVAVWSRRLSESEITALYNGGSGITYSEIPSNVTLNIPTEGYSSSSKTVTFNCSATDDTGVQNISLFLDGVINQTETGGIGQNISLQTTKTLNIGSHNWTCDSYDIANNQGTTETRNLSIVNYLIIDLNEPINNYNSSLATVTFNCSATDDTGVQNISLFLDGVINQTETGGIGQNVSLQEIKSLSDGSHNWTCDSYDTDNNQNTTETRNLTIDFTNPYIEITEPINDILTLTTPSPVNFNVSITEEGIGLQSCIYYNSTANVSITCRNNVSLSLPGGEHTLSYWANDTLGNMGFNSTTFYINVYNYTTHYITPIIEGDTSTIFFNLTATNLSSSITNITYNNTFYTMTTDSSNSTNIIFSKSLTAPQVNEDNIINFSIITSLNNQHLGYLNFSQVVTNISLINCSSGSRILFNFSLVDEALQTWLNYSTIETTVKLYNASRISNFMNLSFSSLVNPVAVCLNATLISTSNYSLDTIVKYSTIDHAVEYYNLIDFRLNSTTPTKNITLYDLNLTDSTEFQLTFTGDDYLPVENALIYVDRQYIPENQFKVVELPKTDSNGQTILHLVRNDVIYNIRVIKNGILLGSFNNLVAYCEDFTIGDCKINLNSADSNANLFIYDNELGISFIPPTYNTTSGIVTFIFSSIDGSTKAVNMSVIRNSVVGNKSICSSLTSSSSGTLTCDISSIDDSIVQINIYVDGDLIIIKQISLTGTNYGVAGYLVLFVMAISFILLFSDSKTGVLVGIILSFVAGVGLGIITGNVIGVGASGLWLIVVCIIGIYKLNKDRPT